MKNAIRARVTFLSVAVASAALVTACGGGSSSGSPAPITMANCYQLTAGNSLNLTTTPSVSSYTLGGTTYPYPSTAFTRSYSNSSYGGQSTIQSRIWTPATGNTTDTQITVTNSLYTRLAYISTPAGGAASTTTYSGNVRNLAVTPGQSQTYTFTSTNAGVTTTTVATLTFVGVEDVTTPTGTYRNACKQTLVQVTGGTPSPSFVSDTFWYAAGYGNVKEVLVYNYTDGRTPSGLTTTTH